MARIVYQAYSEVVTEPKRLNMKSGTLAWRPANPPTRARPSGMSMREKMTMRNPWTMSVMAAAMKPPMTV